MNNKEFEEMNLRYRNSTDYRLNPSLPILLMLDGRSFGKLCKQFEKPFDVWFVETMDKTSQYLCKEIQGVEFCYTQSDEISIYIKPCNEVSTPWFDGRLSKLTSIASSLASSFFLKEFIKYRIEKEENDEYNQYININYTQIVENIEPIQFDCKAWNVPSISEVYDWFTYRQQDCIRNSKSQFAQSYLPHKSLLNLSTDAMIEKVKTEIGKDWNALPQKYKFGRLTYKTTCEYINDDNSSYTRSNYVSVPLLGHCKPHIEIITQNTKN